jgi:predicted site-specific integrase-resolvase
MNDEYIAAGHAISKLNVPLSATTLRLWAETGRIRFIRPGAKRLYLLEDIKREVGVAPIVNGREMGKIIGYARVSSANHKEDLKQQIGYIKEKHPQVSEVVTDIGSSLNYNRTGFNSVLTKVESGLVGTVVVTDKDRVCRFGFEVINRIFTKANAKLVVLSEDPVTSEANEAELAQDLLDVCNFFVAKRNGRKGVRFRSKRTEQLTTKRITGEAVSLVPDAEPEENTNEVVCCE